MTTHILTWLGSRFEDVDKIGVRREKASLQAFCAKQKAKTNSTQPTHLNNNTRTKKPPHTPFDPTLSTLHKPPN